jgi:geranylgeranyl reductase family protein
VLPEYEVIIVGGGPAGIAAAIELRRRKIPCAVLEKAAGRRVKHCGGAVSPSAAKVYGDLGLPEEYFHKMGRAADRGWIHGFGVGLLGRIPGGKPGFFVEREELDWKFQQAARTAHGVVLLYGVGVTSVEIERGAVRVSARRDGQAITFSSRFLIGADGSASIVRARLARSRIAGHNLILTSSSILPAGDVHDPAIRFHEDRMPTYSWIFPYSGERVNVGVGVYASLGREARHSKGVEELIDTPDTAPLSRWIINTNPLQRRSFKGRVLLAGDAGGFVDALTGEGIGFALKSGIAAARAIRMRRFGLPAGLAYFMLVFPLLPRLLLSKVLQLLTCRFPGIAGGFLQLCNRNRFARWALFRYFANC